MVSASLPSSIFLSRKLWFLTVYKKCTVTGVYKKSIETVWYLVRRLRCITFECLGINLMQRPSV